MNVFERLIDYMPLPPVEEDGSVADTPALEFTKVVELLGFRFREHKTITLFSNNT